MFNDNYPINCHNICIILNTAKNIFLPSSELNYV